MASIQPISTSRVTDAMTRRRLTAQIQSNQVDLSRLQNQLSTGFRVFLPSDDPSAALRAVVLQRTIERKTQASTNLAGTVRALSNTESSLQGVANLLIDLNGEALGAVSSLTSKTQRDALVGEIDQALYTLTNTGNAQFVGTYTFAGGEGGGTPYARNQAYVEYQGGERRPQTFVDLATLFDTSVPGAEALGGLSEAVRGVADLNPQLDLSTTVATLNGGAGISPRGAIEIAFQPTVVTDPPTTATIDLTSASSIGDVARLIESSAPAGSAIEVSISGARLVVSTPNGAIAIREVGSGKTASELGIRTSGAPLATVTGTDLNPTIQVTDTIDSLTGTKARGRLVFGGDNNDVVITARQNGAAYNNLTVQVVGGATAGNESANYSAGTNTLTIAIADGITTAGRIASVIEGAGLPFTAEVDYRDADGLAQPGTGLATIGTYANATGPQGSGTTLDLASGLRVTNGASTVVVNTSSARTVEDVLNLLNDPALGLRAAVNGSGTGIDVRSRRSGAPFSISENGGTTAAGLGIRTYTASSRLDGFNRGVGVFDAANPNRLRIAVADNGTTTNYDINTTGAVTVGDVLAQINTQTGGAVTATLATVGNGFVLRGAAAAAPGAAASGALTLGGDTLTITAGSVGTAGNRPFTFEVVDTGAGGLATSVVGDVITVDLGGATPTTAQVATSVTGSLTGYTVVSGGTATLSAAVAVQPAATIGGANASAAGADSLTVSGNVAGQLGFFAKPADSVTSTTNEVVAEDRNTQEVDSVFTTLLRMREALVNNEPEALGRELQRLDDDINRVTFARADVGSRLQSLDSLEKRLEDEDVTLRSALSDEIEADPVETITELTAKQYALQASLRLASQQLQQTLLDYL
ncbi:MAG: flagellin [Lacipirellulaceae bacterium]